MDKITLSDILVEKRLLIENDEIIEDENTRAYYNAYLLSNFGVILDKPEKVNKTFLEQITSYLCLYVPSSFYENPQDTKFFRCDELLIEQLVSYYLGYGTDIKRIEIFKKDLPQYVYGDELVLRKFEVISKEEAQLVAKEIMNDYCAYTRPLSIFENEEFKYLYLNGYYQNQEISCKDNIFTLLEFKPEFAKNLDKKDLVKLSIKYFGEYSNVSESVNDNLDLLEIISKAMDYVYDCPMSKKQAKYYNKLRKLCNKKYLEKASNETSPNKLAIKAIKDGNVIDAAKVFAANGSMLQRNIKFLLSRANPNEALTILEMLPTKNPIVLYQLMTSLDIDNGEPRSFSFVKNNLVKSHLETEYEATWRKSRLNDSTKKLLKDFCLNKISEHYSNLPKLGKVYIDEEFNRVALPINTSANGKGLDVPPTGSIIKLPKDNIRTFVHWKNAFDIDSSLIVIDANNHKETLDFRSYHSKPYGNSLLFSGDVTSSSGAEYYDIKLDELKEKGYKYIVQGFYGYSSNLNEGEIYAGYQNKDDLDTKAWDPKNIAMKYRIKGDTRGALSFAINIETKEMVILNLMIQTNSQVINAADINNAIKIMSPSYLEFNMATLASLRGEVVPNPEEADLVFSDTYQGKENQTLIRSFDKEKMVKLINE